MTPEHWAKVTEVFEAALEVEPPERKALVAGLCGDDADLIEVVQSLLDSHDEAEATGSGRWRAATPLTMPVEVKGRIGPYEVLGKLGAGGMAEVYRVRDERLGREVAFKILLPEYADDEEYLERFRREARAASVLEHPNICRLYDMGEWQGRPFLTMELLEGQTLRQQMNNGLMALDEILPIAIHVANALGAAHARGFVHRDIKPANIFLTAAGEVKILDFGLAKRIRSERKHAPEEATLTKRLATPGTPAYMAPEQILGGESDARTDTYALGVVLYEMVTGKTPFQGENATDVFRSALGNLLVAPSRLRPELPKELERIIQRALERDCDLRYQTALDLRAELRRLGRVEIPSGPQPLGPARTDRRSWLIGAAGLAAVGGVLFWKREPGVPVQPKLRLVGAAPGFKDSPVLSPSGDRMAYTVVDGVSRVLLTQMETGASLRISKSEYPEGMPVWSPDGNYLAYRRGGNGRGYYIMPSLGGGDLKAADVFSEPAILGGRNIDWSPDGRLILVDQMSAGEPEAIFAVNATTRERSKLVGDGGFLSMPSVSPDGRWLAYVKGGGPRTADLYVQPMAGGQRKQLTKDGRWIAGVTWSKNSNTLVWSSNRIGLFQLWSMDINEEIPKLVPATGADAYSPSISKDGKRLSFVRRRLSINLWRAGQRITNSSRVSVDGAMSPDGKRIAYASDRSGNWEIWVTDGEGKQELRMTSMGGGQSGSPRWSNDGTLIYFVSDRSGVEQVWRVAVGGGDAVPAVNESVFRMVPRQRSQTVLGYWPTAQLAGGTEASVSIEEKVELMDSEILVVEDF